MSHTFEQYKIKVEGHNGPEAKTIYGVIVGPFGVARDKYSQEYTDGSVEQFHKVTHRHSGLNIAQLSSWDIEDCIAACKELEIAVPWWSSYKIDRIEKENQLEQGELKSIVLDVARRNNCQNFNGED